MPLYAAYGSNMDPEQMPPAGTALPDGRHRLALRLASDVCRRGHRLGGRTGHLVEDPVHAGCFVVLYDVTPTDEQNMDRWEGSEMGLHKKIRCRIDRESSDTATDPALAWLYVIDAWEGSPALGATSE